MTTRRVLTFLLLAWFAGLASPGTLWACPLCYGGDDPDTGRATLWAGAVLVVTVYGVLSAGAWWAWRRVRSHRPQSQGAVGEP